MEINQSSPTGSGGLPLGNGQKPGERLRQVRTSQKRELSDLSRELNIPERILAALEADDYAALPEPAFVRGYLRSYAKCLGVDANALVARFTEIYAADTGRTATQALNDSPLKPLAKISSRKQKRSWRWLRWVLLLLVVASVLYALMQWLSSEGATTDAVQPIPTETLEILPVPQVTSSSSTTVPMATTLPIQTPAAGQTDRLVLQLSRAADVQIKDATGKDLLSGQQQATQPLQIDGQSPFSITLPEADAVQQLSLNGEQVRLSPYIVNGRAEFRLSR
jgi:cytoskeletal protein RodZ